MEISFTIPGDPQGKDRPRLNHNTKVVYTPTNTKNYEEAVAWIYRSKYGSAMFAKDTALDLRIRAFYRIPESDSMKKKRLKQLGLIRPLIKPDWDNVGKVVSDALNKIAFHDDAQIVDAQVRKFYSFRPRVEVKIKEVGEIENE